MLLKKIMLDNLCSCPCSWTELDAYLFRFPKQPPTFIPLKIEVQFI